MSAKPDSTPSLDDSEPISGIEPKVIGEGTFGCVHKPPLKCNNNTRRKKDSISKLMTEHNATKELGEFNHIAAADADQHFYLGKPDKCKLDPIEDNMRAINNCPSKKFNPDKIRDYALLVMKYGGQDLDAFGEEVQTWTKTKEHVDAIELFWLEAVRLFYGLKVLHDNNVVHHDLKQQNIVYDQSTNRANFIDFGFMEKRSTRIYASKMSSNWLGNNHHWSFPLEAIYWNKDEYMAAARRGKTKKAYREFAHSVANNCRYFFTSTLRTNDSKTQKNKMVKQVAIDAFSNVLEFEPTVEAYNRFIDKSIDSVDTYGLGIALMFVLHRCKHLLTPDFSMKLGGLFAPDMFNRKVFLRSTPEQLLAKYEDILTTSGLLEKHNKHIENHLIANGVSTEMKVAAAIDDSSFMIVIPPAAENENIEINRDCPPGKEFNPRTKRCVNVCAPGKVRNPDFKCVRDKIVAPEPKVKTCSNGKELNPTTKRCVKTCKVGQVRNAEFKCVRDATARKTRKVKIHSNKQKSIKADNIFSRTA